MKITIPIRYEDGGMQVLSDGSVAPIFHEATLERLEDDPRLVRVTLPPGRRWVLLPADLFSDKVLA